MNRQILINMVVGGFMSLASVILIKEKHFVFGFLLFPVWIIGMVNSMIRPK